MTEETALTVLNDQSLAVPDGPEYIIKPSILLLTQTNHVGKFDNAIPGAFRDKDSGKNFLDDKGKPKPIRAILLRVETPRVYFEGDDLNLPPVCRSLDSVVPITGPLAEKFGLQPQHSTCKGCPKNNWDHFRDTKHPLFKIPAPCKERPRITFCDEEDEMPYILTLTPSSVSTLKQKVIGVVRKNSESEWNKSKNNPNRVRFQYYDYKVDILSEKFYNYKNQLSYKLEFSNLERVAEQGKYKELYQKYIVMPMLKFATPEANQEAAIEGEVVNE